MLVSCAVALALTAAPSIETAWRTLPTTGSACNAEGMDYGLSGGMRTFYCRAFTVFPYERLLKLAPVKPFLSGPHGDGLNLHSKDTFGHYDPAFVRWASHALVPAAGNEPLRRATQRTYEQQMRSLARQYFRVYRVLFADQAWLSRMRTAYLAAARTGNGDWSGPGVQAFEALFRSAQEKCGDAEPHVVRAATMWWLRRSEDQTAELWREGLERLLTTYDAKWLAAERRKPATAPD